MSGGVLTLPNSMPATLLMKKALSLTTMKPAITGFSNLVSILHISLKATAMIISGKWPRPVHVAPCTEIHYDFGPPEACDKQGVEGHVCEVNGDCNRIVEIWNNVLSSSIACQQLISNRCLKRTLIPAWVWNALSLCSKASREITKPIYSNPCSTKPNASPGKVTRNALKTSPPIVL